MRLHDWTMTPKMKTITSMTVARFRPQLVMIPVDEDINPSSKLEDTLFLQAYSLRTNFLYVTLSRIYLRVVFVMDSGWAVLEKEEYMDKICPNMTWFPFEKIFLFDKRPFPPRGLTPASWARLCERWPF